MEATYEQLQAALELFRQAHSMGLPVEPDDAAEEKE